MIFKTSYCNLSIKEVTYSSLGLMSKYLHLMNIEKVYPQLQAPWMEIPFQIQISNTRAETLICTLRYADETIGQACDAVEQAFPSTMEDWKSFTVHDQGWEIFRHNLFPLFSFQAKKAHPFCSTEREIFSSSPEIKTVLRAIIILLIHVDLSKKRMWYNTIHTMWHNFLWHMTIWVSYLCEKYINNHGILPWEKALKGWTITKV